MSTSNDNTALGNERTPALGQEAHHGDVGQEVQVVVGAVDASTDYRGLEYVLDILRDCVSDQVPL